MPQRDTKNSRGDNNRDHKHKTGAPSPWIARFFGEIPQDGPVLDLACGTGRHSRLLLDAGYRVIAVDRDLSRFIEPADHPNLKRITCDLEADPPDFGTWIPEEPGYAGILVVNYLHRPLFPRILSALRPGGVLLYETFARGNERFGRPRSPEFLLKPGELLNAVAGKLRVLAYEDLVIKDPRPAAVQRIFARQPERD
jgi:SAM-dependent methyltransferase